MSLFDKIDNNRFSTLLAVTECSLSTLMELRQQQIKLCFSVFIVCQHSGTQYCYRLFVAPPVCWPDCKPEGPLFSAEFVCESVCLSVCL